MISKFAVRACLVFTLFIALGAGGSLKAYERIIAEAAVTRFIAGQSLESLSHMRVTPISARGI